MKAILLTALSWISKVPGSTINEIFTAATGIVEASDNAGSSVSGWEKLRNSVEYLVSVTPLDARYKAIASIVVTIVVNVALLIIRLKNK
jgi:hypothetical protein